MTSLSRIVGTGMAEPETPRGTLADALACRATRQACDDAKVDPRSIEMIVTMSVSPSGLAVRPDLIGPRFGYIVHRTLQCDDAFVLDLVDADWIFALEQALLFARHQGYRRVLLVRAERLADVSGDYAGVLADGAAALLIDVADTPPARYRYLPSGGLVAMRIGSGTPGDLVRFERHQPVTFVDDWIPPDWRDGDGLTVIERWESSKTAIAGIFELPAQIAVLRRDGYTGRLRLVGLDIFKGRLGTIEVSL